MKLTSVPTAAVERLTPGVTTTGDHEWFSGEFPVADLPEPPTQQQDVEWYVRRHKNSKGDFKPIVVTVYGNSISVWDGAHRIAAARQLGLRAIPAYVGFLKS